MYMYSRMQKKGYGLPRVHEEESVEWQYCVYEWHLQIRRHGVYDEYLWTGTGTAAELQDALGQPANPGDHLRSFSEDCCMLSPLSSRKRLFCRLYRRSLPFSIKMRVEGLPKYQSRRSYICSNSNVACHGRYALCKSSSLSQRLAHSPFSDITRTHWS